MDTGKLIFFKGTELLITIRNTKPSDRFALKLAKITGLGYARVNQLINIFKQLGLIEFKKLNGRTKGVKLTAKGEEIASNLNAIKQAVL